MDKMTQEEIGEFLDKRFDKILKEDWENLINWVSGRRGSISSCQGRRHACLSWRREPQLEDSWLHQLNKQALPLTRSLWSLQYERRRSPHVMTYWIRSLGLRASSRLSRWSWTSRRRAHCLGMRTTRGIVQWRAGWGQVKVQQRTSLERMSCTMLCRISTTHCPSLDSHQMEHIPWWR